MLPEAPAAGEELSMAGWNTLTGADSEKIVRTARQVTQNWPPDHLDFYGNADAAIQIISNLL